VTEFYLNGLVTLPFPHGALLSRSQMAHRASCAILMYATLLRPLHIWALLKY
jgi:hypothetical protein